jgi:RNA polymerase primary sigma factor
VLATCRECDDLSRYFKRVREYPPLTRDEEHVLALHASQGEASAKQNLVRHNLGFVIAIVRNQRRGTLRLDELVQEGNVGLMRAIEKFDPRAGARFSTYAIWWIRAYVGRYLKEARSMVRLPRGTFAQPDASLDATIWESGHVTHLELLEADGARPEDSCLSGEREPARCAQCSSAGVSLSGWAGTFYRIGWGGTPRRRSPRSGNA